MKTEWVRAKGNTGELATIALSHLLTKTNDKACCFAQTGGERRKHASSPFDSMVIFVGLCCGLFCLIRKCCDTHPAYAKLAIINQSCLVFVFFLGHFDTRWVWIFQHSSLFISNSRHSTCQVDFLSKLQQQQSSVSHYEFLYRQQHWNLTFILEMPFETVSLSNTKSIFRDDYMPFAADAESFINGGSTYYGCQYFRRAQII